MEFSKVVSLDLAPNSRDVIEIISKGFLIFLLSRVEKALIVIRRLIII
jgi:hypothetical protein